MGRRSPHQQEIGKWARWLVVLWVLLAPAVVRCEEAPAPSGDVLTLEQAIALASENNRQVRNTQLEVSKAHNQLAAVRTQRLPAFDFQLQSSELLTPVDFSFRKGSFGTFPGTGPIPATDIDVSSSRALTTYLTTSIAQPLTQLHRIRLGIRLREAGVQTAQESVRSQRQSVVAQVKQTYYGLLQTQSGVEAAEESVRFYRELERTTGESVAQQAALRADLLEVQARRARQEYDLYTLRNSLATGKEQLNVLLGRDIRTPFQLAPVSPAPLDEADLTALQARALRQHPELRGAALRVQQADLDRRIKRSEFIPDVSFGLFLVSQFNIDIVAQQILSAGIKLTWEPFDWGRKHEEVAEKARAVEQARNAQEDTAAQVLLEVHTQFRKMQEARELVRVTEASQAAARERVRLAMDRYAVKAVLLKDVFEAQATMADANHQHEQALLGLATAQAALERAVGEDK